MSQLLPYRPLHPDVIHALERLERDGEFDASAFAVANQERWRRIPLSLMLAAAGLGALIVWLADSAGWLGVFAPLFYVLLVPVFAGASLNLLRGDSLKDELRLGRAISRWEGRGGVIRDEPLEK